MIRRLTHRFVREEEGIALVTAIVLSATMMVAVIGTVTFADGQQRESGIERRRESSFNLGEGAMTAQIVRLAQQWRGRAQVSATRTCSEQTTQADCPSAADVLATFSSADTAVPPRYRIWVRDDGQDASIVNPERSCPPEYYSDAAVADRAAYDRNDNGCVWVRAQATVRGRTRTLIARVQVQEQQEDLPRYALLSGRLKLANNGNKVLLEPRSGAEVGPVAVRCTVSSTDSTPCLGHTLTGSTDTQAKLYELLATQVPGVTPTTGAFPNGERAFDAETVARLKVRAMTDATYYTSCPSQLDGEVVVIDGASCTYTGNDVFNTADRPGLLILTGSATIELKGTTQYHGVVYHENPLNLTSTIVTVHGNATLTGGLIVEGQGTAEVGESKTNVVYSPKAFQSLRSYGSAGILQNTFREISAPPTP